MLWNVVTSIRPACSPAESERHIRATGWRPRGFPKPGEDLSRVRTPCEHTSRECSESKQGRSPSLHPVHRSAGPHATAVHPQRERIQYVFPQRRASTTQPGPLTIRRYAAAHALCQGATAPRRSAATLLRNEQVGAAQTAQYGPSHANTPGSSSFEG